jgi:hypothetical protein
VATRDWRREYDKHYRQENRARINNRQRIKNRKMRKKRNQLNQNWKKKHPMDSKRTTLTANAVKFGVSDRISVAELEALWVAQGGVCPFTLLPLEPRKATAHHIIHLAKGGSNTIDNLIFTTRQVHNLKRKMPLEEFCQLSGLDAALVLHRMNQVHERYAAQVLIS